MWKILGEIFSCLMAPSGLNLHRNVNSWTIQEFSKEMDSISENCRKIVTRKYYAERSIKIESDYFNQGTPNILSFRATIILRCPCRGQMLAI